MSISRNSILDTTVSAANLFDSHCHLQFPEFDLDRAEVIARAQKAGLSKIVLIGIDQESIEKGTELAQSDPSFFELAIGHHPYHADQTDDDFITYLQKQIDQHPFITAIGETGLDYFRCQLPKEVQINSLTKHAKLAKLNNLNLILHTRETDDCLEDTLAVLAEQGTTKAIFHCFAGSLASAQKIWQLGYKTSFGGNITYKNNSHLLEIARLCPPELLLLETDSPYLTPAPNRQERNEPANIPTIYQHLTQEG